VTAVRVGLVSEDVATVITESGRRRLPRSPLVPVP